MARTYRICLLTTLMLLQACSSDDAAPPVNKGADASAISDAGAGSDAANATDAAGAPDLGEYADDAGPDSSVRDVGADAPNMGKEPGPRAALQYRGHRLVQQSRVARLDVAPSADGFFVATASAGDPVVWSLGEADEQTIDAVFPQTFKSIWAHYDNDLNLRATRAISSYPGGPLEGGTSSATSIELEPGGDRLMAGEIMGSVDFGGTVWSTTFSSAAGNATEGYVARTTDTSETALFRLRTQNALDSVYLTSLVRHDDGDLTLGGWFGGTMYLPDGTTLSDVDGRGFIVHTGPDGTPTWTLQVPGSFTYVDRSGDKLLVRTRLPRDAGFRFDGLDYPAPTLDWADGIALVNDDGAVDWFRRLEAGPNVPTIRGSAPLANGGVVVAYTGQSAVLPELPASPSFNGDARLIAFDTNGEILWTTDFADERVDYLSVAVDSFGVAWAAVETCADEALNLEPKWSPDVTVPPCGPPDSQGNRPEAQMLLLGYDTANGELGYAHPFSLGSVSVAGLEVLADDSLLIMGNYFEPITVMPGTANEQVVDGLLGGPNDQVLLVLSME